MINLAIKPPIRNCWKKAFIQQIMSSLNLPKLWTELTKIGHIFRKQIAMKNSICKSWSCSLILFTGKKTSERFRWFLMLKNDFESQNFAIFEEVVYNFVKVWQWHDLSRGQLISKALVLINRYNTPSETIQIWMSRGNLYPHLSCCRKVPYLLSRLTNL